jgi:ribonuclease PH
MFGSLLRKAQYSSLDLSESQQENAEDSDVRDEREEIQTVLISCCMSCVFIHAFPDVGITSPVNILRN